ncbi:hypothetical protein CVT24_007404 [Panaeolus cyanescens]|uniref:GST N-terminal domain-containing protein n=1 Tax=Panaeolus cyanescens TaxID=181874 RepID=A0A409YKX8_9AGAR|nr:hypothetical protein CVT24_007404 [Panaeolus cyanescens]
MIIFYDIPTKWSGVAWSPNTWKTRYALNYKGIPYKTEWVEFPDIEKHCISLSIPTKDKKADGSPYYSLPAIWDTDTGVKLSDSLEILKYLETTYPNKPTLFPNNTQGVLTAFEGAFKGQLDALWEFILPAVSPAMNPRSEEYFTRTRTASFGKPLADVVPTGAERKAKWAKYKADLDVVNEWYKATDNAGPWLLGDALSSGDLIVGGFTIWLKVLWGEDSEEWKDISSWNNGRWARIVGLLGQYSEVK